MAKQCPACGDEAVVRIVYGLVNDPETFRKKLGEDVILGGCSVSEGQPRWACRECEARFTDEGLKDRSETGDS